MRNTVKIAVIGTVIITGGCTVRGMVRIKIKVIFTSLA